jgi:hypothetical protein
LASASRFGFSGISNAGPRRVEIHDCVFESFCVVCEVPESLIAVFAEDASGPTCLVAVVDTKALVCAADCADVVGLNGTAVGSKLPLSDGASTAPTLEPVEGTAVSREVADRFLCVAAFADFAAALVFVVRVSAAPVLAPSG